MFDQTYRKNTKICNVEWVYYENIIKEEYNDT